MFMGHQKGTNTKEDIQLNFGMPTPQGYVVNYKNCYIVVLKNWPVSQSKELGQVVDDSALILH